MGELKGVVRNISLGLGGLHSPIVSGEDWQAFRPDGILKTYGLPKEVKIVMGEGPEGRVSYEMALVYDKLFAIYDGNQTIITPQHILHACPLVDQNIDQFRLQMGEFDLPKLWDQAPGITQLSNVTDDSFYQLMVDDPTKACFDLDYHKFKLN